MTPKERLLEAADALFYEDGVHTVGIDRVLARAGVAKASLYSNFGNKDGLVRAYLRGRDERLRARIMKRIESETTPKARILSIFDVLHARIQEGGYGGCAFIRASSEGPPGPNAAREMSVDHRAWRIGLFEQLALAAGLAGAKELSLQLSFLYDGAATAYAMEHEPNVALVARRAAESLIDSATTDK